MAIEAVIKGLSIEPFVSYPAREKPLTIEDLYNEFDNYYRSKDNLRNRVKEHNQFRETSQSQGNQPQAEENKQQNKLQGRQSQ